MTMHPTIEKLTDQALGSPDHLRLQLMKRLMDSLSGQLDPEVESEWLRLAQMRWAELAPGAVESVDYRESLKRLRNRIG